MADTLSLLSVIAFVIAGISLAVAIFLWFFFHISSVIGDLSGRTARKSIEKMRAANERSGKKSYRVSSVNMERGKVTDTMPGTGKSQKQQTEKLKKEKQIPAQERTRFREEEKPETGLLAGNMERSYEAEQTELLMRETEAITDPGAAGLSANEDTTEPLTAGSGTTERPKNAKKNGFVILEEILLIHTDEEIAEI